VRGVGIFSSKTYKNVSYQIPEGVPFQNKDSKNSQHYWTSLKGRVDMEKKMQGGGGGMEGTPKDGN